MEEFWFAIPAHTVECCYLCHFNLSIYIIICLQSGYRVSLCKGRNIKRLLQQTANCFNNASPYKLASANFKKVSSYFTGCINC